MAPTTMDCSYAMVTGGKLVTSVVMRESTARKDSELWRVSYLQRVDAHGLHNCNGASHTSLRVLDPPFDGHHSEVAFEAHHAMQHHLQ